MKKPSYILGVDPGQSADPTALALLEHDAAVDPTYRLRGLYRFPLGTPYTELVRRIEDGLKRRSLSLCRVAIDATGVGAPVVDLLKAAIGQSRLYAITITGGSSVGGTTHDPHVPKRDLIANTSLILEQRRLRISTALDETEALVEELHGYRRIVADSGQERYDAAGGLHDDLILALSLALWIGDRTRAHGRSRMYVAAGPVPSTDDWLRNKLGQLYNF